MSLDRILADQLVERRVATGVIDSFAGACLTLAALGLYGLLAVLVASRRREIGVRLALGASPAGVAGVVVRESVFNALLGVGIGLVLALVAARFVEALLVGVSGTDPWTLSAVAAVMLAVSIGAALAPAWRAARVESGGRASFGVSSGRIRRLMVRAVSTRRACQPGKRAWP